MFSPSFFVYCFTVFINTSLLSVRVFSYGKKRPILVVLEKDDLELSLFQILSTTETKLREEGKNISLLELLEAIEIKFFRQEEVAYNLVATEGAIESSHFGNCVEFKRYLLYNRGHRQSKLTTQSIIAGRGLLLSGKGEIPQIPFSDNFSGIDAPRMSIYLDLPYFQNRIMRCFSTILVMGV